jgi:hypothetical protein
LPIASNKGQQAFTGGKIQGIETILPECILICKCLYWGLLFIAFLTLRCKGFSMQSILISKPKIKSNKQWQGGWSPLPTSGRAREGDRFFETK